MISRFVLDHLSPPYLVVRIVPRMFHLRVLPATMAFEELASIARAQVSANRLDAYLKSDRGTRHFYTKAPTDRRPGDGAFVLLNHPGSVPVCDRLKASRPFPPTEELMDREALLTRLCNEYLGNRGTYMRKSGQAIPAPFAFGDFTKGGHEPSVEEIIGLTRQPHSGVRAGLDRCSVCGDWRGECLDKIEFIGTRVVPVHCRCDNENSCARCGARLGERCLNGNYYKESTDEVWHVPGFEGLRHECRV